MRKRIRQLEEKCQHLQEERLPLQEMLEEIRKKDPAAKVIMCSAMGQEQMITNALMLGASDFIVKPFKADEFMKVVEYTLSS